MKISDLPPPVERDANFNFAYLDERTKRMIRRAILKAVAIPGYQVPFGSREMPLPYGWGTGGIQVTASIIGPADVLKVIDQGADDTVNAVNIRRFFQRTTAVAVTSVTTEATIIQTRHRIPETPLQDGQVIVYQVPQPEPLQKLEPREAEILTHRFGLNGESPLTLEEVGELFKLTRERVRQLQQSALMQLRRIMTERQKLLTPEDVKKNKLAEARSGVLSEFFRSKGITAPPKGRPGREGL